MSRSRRSDERGSALVESAIVTPIVALLIFGVLEFGLALKDYVSMASGVRNGARTASVQGDASDADYQILQSIVKRMPGLNKSQVLRVVVYKATGPSTVVPTACKTASVTNSCNSYSNTDLNRPSTDFTGTGSAPDRYWAPTSRKTALSDPPDYVGVYVQVSHVGLTKFVNLTDTYDDQIVMRIEPNSE